MQDFEKLGVFYLGRLYDMKAKSLKEELLLYDSKDLVTHAVCVGMTGSGKTGLCISLIEEAAIDGIPAIVIDPKGDLSNLLLTFPELKGDDFAPWVNEDDAKKAGISTGEYAGQQAELWKNGLSKWGESGERIKRLRDSADFVIYTPGSNAGIPISILKSFSAPDRVILEDNDLLRERVSNTATSLLGLLGIEADPVRSREHILISTILDSAWKQGKDLTLETLVQQIQTPPVNKFGVLDLDSFYPSKDRFGLAMLLNNLLAAPGFEAWLEGDALDIDSILHTPEGKPRVAVFSIAHLNDQERMFFVSLLLNQILGWMRTQSGTNSLRALLYMDEIYGYLPPIANPPSKLPLLTLLKQARAFGVGIVLATQNPVDLEYKGLSNTGTWFIGRLQTERDKARLIEGLEGASVSTGMKFDRQGMEETLAGLGNRVFLMNNVHDDTPVVLQTRWTMSYLRGPITRTQIKTLMDGRKVVKKGIAPPSPLSPDLPHISAGVLNGAPYSSHQHPTRGEDKIGKLGQRPLLTPGVPEYFVPIRRNQPVGTTLVYQPMLIGAGQVRFVDTRTKLNTTVDKVFLVPITQDAVPVRWDDSTECPITVSDLENAPLENAQYGELPAIAGKPKNYDTWRKDFANWLYRNERLELLKSPALKETSKHGESERDFRLRLEQISREKRDELKEKLRQKYAPKTATIEERLRRAEQAVAREAEQAKQQKLQTAISFGAAVLGSFLGRKKVSAYSLGRATTAMRGAGRTMKESQDVDRAEETVEALKKKLADLEAEFQSEIESLEIKTNPLTETLETITIMPAKTNISVQLTALTWLPNWQDEQAKLTPAWK